MKSGKDSNKVVIRQRIPPVSLTGRDSHGRIVAAQDESQCLNAEQLTSLERSFRDWAEGASRMDVRLSRQRVLLIFLLIRHTGAKLNEVLALDTRQDIAFDRQLIFLGNRDSGVGRTTREVYLSENLAREIRAMLTGPLHQDFSGKYFAVDPGFLRRKFYERAETCGFPKRLGSPEMIRKARGVELLQNNMPLPAVQMLLGQSTPRAFSHVAFSESEIRQVTRCFLEREASRNSSARNVFWGKIQTIRRGDIQTMVLLVTIGGQSVTTVITNNSLERLGLKEGKMIAAEVKAPWVFLQKGEEPESSAENRFQGIVTRIVSGEIATEYVVRIADGTELCAIVSSEGGRRLALREQDSAWALFNAFSVVLHID